MKSQLWEKRRLTRQRKILERLKDLPDNDVLPIDLMTTAIALVARRYPATLTAANKRAILENYSDATEACIAERAMAPKGVSEAIALGHALIGITLDYCADSNVTDQFTRDQARESSINHEQLIDMSDQLYRCMKNSGLSEFGVLASRVMYACEDALNGQLNRYQVCRALNDAISMVYSGKLDPPEKVRAAAVEEFARRMGITVATAKRYLRDSKKKKASRRKSNDS